MSINRYQLSKSLLQGLKHVRYKGGIDTEKSKNKKIRAICLVRDIACRRGKK